MVAQAQRVKRGVSGKEHWPRSPEALCWLLREVHLSFSSVTEEVEVVNSRSLQSATTEMICSPDLSAVLRRKVSVAWAAESPNSWPLSGHYSGVGLSWATPTPFHQRAAAQLSPSLFIQLLPGNFIS